jgi:MFS transporter, ACS family, hexuronate transporter
MIAIPKLRWVIAAMLLLATTLNYIDRLTLSVVITDIRKQFSLSAQDYSQIVGLFLLAYAVMYTCSGYVIDRLGTRKGFVVFMLGWSAAQFLQAFARGKWSLGGCRFLLVKAVNEWSPPSQRAIGVGIFNAGSALGSAVAVPVAAFLALHYGWRFTFLFTGALGFLWLALWLLLYQPPARNRWLSRKEAAELQTELAANSEPQAGAFRGPWYRLLQMKQCYALILARFLTDPVAYFMIFGCRNTCAPNVVSACKWWVNLPGCPSCLPIPAIFLAVGFPAVLFAGDGR